MKLDKLLSFLTASPNSIVKVDCNGVLYDINDVFIEHGAVHLRTYGVLSPYKKQVLDLSYGEEYITLKAKEVAEELVDLCSGLKREPCDIDCFYSDGFSDNENTFDIVINDSAIILRLCKNNNTPSSKFECLHFESDYCDDKGACMDSLTKFLCSCKNSVSDRIINIEKTFIDDVDTLRFKLDAYVIIERL